MEISKKKKIIPLEKYVVVVSPVADVPCHVHQGLLCEYLAVVPAADLHRRSLVANLLDLLYVATPSRQEAIGVFAEAKGVAQPVEASDLVQHSNYFVPVVVEGYGCRTTPETGADNNYWL